MMILNQKRIQATIAFDDGTDALHANAVTRFIGYRNSIFKWNVIPAGVFHLQKETSTPVIKLHINDACLFRSGKGLAKSHRIRR